MMTKAQAIETIGQMPGLYDLDSDALEALDVAITAIKRSIKATKAAKRAAIAKAKAARKEAAQ